MMKMPNKYAEDRSAWSSSIDFNDILTVAQPMAYCTLILMFLVSIVPQTMAQEIKEEKISTGDLARERIHQLKKGTVVVRLRSFRKKLEQLQTLSESGDLPEGQRKNLKEKYESTLADRDDFNRRFMKSFIDHYNFSEIRFAYDTSFQGLAELDYSKISLIGEDLLPDESIQIDKFPVFVLGYGNTDPSRTSGIESWIVHDKYMNPLSRPFPYYVPAKGLPKKITYLKYDEEQDAYTIMKKKGGRLKGTDRIVARWQRDLQTFYLDTYNYEKRTSSTEKNGS